MCNDSAIDEPADELVLAVPRLYETIKRPKPTKVLVRRYLRDQRG